MNVLRRQDWWCGVLLIVLILVLHSALPRFQWLPAQHPSETSAQLAISVWLRVDGWTGEARLFRFGREQDRGRLVPVEPEISN